MLSAVLEDFGGASRHDRGHRSTRGRAMTIELLEAAREGYAKEIRGVENRYRSLLDAGMQFEGRLE